KGPAGTLRRLQTALADLLALRHTLLGFEGAGLGLLGLGLGLLPQGLQRHAALGLLRLAFLDQAPVVQRGSDDLLAEAEDLAGKATDVLEFDVADLHDCPFA